MYRRYWRPIFIGTVGLIAIVLVVGRAARGSTRWIDVGFFTFQPSEFGKLLFVLAIAGFITERAQGAATARTTLRTLGLGAIPVVLVFAQPDLGTALVYIAALGAMLFVCGTPWKQLAVLGVARRARGRGRPLGRARRSASTSSSRTRSRASPVSCIRRSAPSTRATTSSSRSRPSARASSTAAARRTRRRRGSTSCPEHGTDFVFASYSEQRGFIGASLLLALYLLVLWRGLRIVTVARDLYSAIVAGGIVVALLFQIFVNVGMTMGIAPITGIPLPFVSVGGSSMIANLAAMGVLLAIHARGRGSRSSRRRRYGVCRSRSASLRGARQGDLRLRRRRASRSSSAGRVSSRRCCGGSSAAARSRARVRADAEPRGGARLRPHSRRRADRGRRGGAEARAPRARADRRDRDGPASDDVSLPTCSRRTSSGSSRGRASRSRRSRA